MPVTTIAPKPIFVFGGNTQSNQSTLQFSTKPSSSSGFSLSPPKFSFGTEFSLPFTVDTKSFLDVRVNTFSSGQSQPLGKDTDDAEIDSQAEEWLTESESEYLGSEPNLEHSEDENDEPSNHEQCDPPTDTSLTNTADTSVASVNTVTDEQPEENKLETDLATFNATDDSISEEQQPSS